MKVRSITHVSLTWYELGWPANLDNEAVSNWLQALSGSVNSSMRFVVQADHMGCKYFLGIPTAQAVSRVDLLHTFLPDIEVTELDDTPDHHMGILFAARLSMSSRQRQLLVKQPERVAHTIIGSLTDMLANSAVTITWILGPRTAPQEIKSFARRLQSKSWLGSIVEAAFKSSTATVDPTTRRSMRNKYEQPGWNAVCYVGIYHSTLKGRINFMRRIEAALKSADAVGVSLSMRPMKRSVFNLEAQPWFWNLSLNVSELSALIGWPYGDNHLPGITRILSRHMPVPPRSSLDGKIIARCNVTRNRKRLYLDTQDALMHTHILGPTGVGKSTLLLNMARQDIKDGYGVIMVDPKGDLIEDLLQRIPPKRVNDVVVMDPSDSRPVGLNPLICGDKPPTLVIDDLIAVFRSLYATHFGPRTQDILHAGLLTIMNYPDMTLATLPALFSNPVLRTRLISRLDDPLGLSSFWSWFENISDNERQYVLTPVLNKLRPFLMREHLRRVIGQAHPKFDISEVFTENKILLVNLARNKMGTESSQLFGALVIAQIWQAIQARGNQQPKDRTPCFVYIDEVQDYLHLPTDIGDVLTQARSYGVGMVLAHQYLNQLPPGLRSGVLSNARSRICFQLSHEDAVVMARSSRKLEARDFENLGKYHIYARLVANGTVTQWASGVTRPAAKRSSDPGDIKTFSQTHYGIAAADVESAIGRQLILKTKKSGKQHDSLFDIGFNNPKGLT